LIDLQNPKKSLIKGKKIRNFLEKEFFQDKEFKDTKIKLIIVATDVEKNTPVYFTSGKIIDAVMYSLSIPGVFPLNEYKGKLLTDGQVTEHLPVNILFEKGMDKVLGVDVLTNIKIDLEEIKNSTFNLLLALFYRGLITSKIKNDENIFIFSPNFIKKDTKIGNNLRFDKIEANFKPGENIVKKE
jgi:NTE family protein